MTQQEYYKEKDRINSIEDLSQEQKEVLTMDLRIQYYGIDRSGLNHMDSFNFKPAIIRVI